MAPPSGPSPSLHAETGEPDGRAERPARGWRPFEPDPGNAGEGSGGWQRFRLRERAAGPAGSTTPASASPVPTELRRLRAFDIGVLWGDLAIGVLVLAAGALLVTPPTPAGWAWPSAPRSLAIAIGSVAGSLLLASVAAAGHDRGVPTMVLLRPVLGRYGSYGASAVNVLQLIGWTAFELWAMALFANRVSDQVFGFTAFGLWLAVMALICTGLALIGPVRVVRVWLEKVGAWWCSPHAATSPSI